MYIQITTRCNMRCEHCCFSCEKVGEDMPFSMFKDIVDKWGEKMQKDRNRILIGGGEPTVHPDLWKILDYAKIYGLPMVVTNGKKTMDAMKIAKLAKKGEMWGVLSLDKWHEPINKKVIDVFMDGLVIDEHGNWYKSINKLDKRRIKITKKARKQGRYLNNRDGVGGCCCPLLQVKPNGIIYGCGCFDAPIVGSVKDGFLDCYKNLIPSFQNPPVYRICSKKWEIK